MFFLIYVKLFLKIRKFGFFGAWQGDKYSDNSRYFYEYLIKNNLNKNV